MSSLLKKYAVGVAGAMALALAGTSGASAATFGSIPDGAVNEALQPLFGTDTRNGWYGASLYLIGGPSDILVEYLGSEAGFENNFTFGSFTQDTPGGNAFNPAGFTEATLLNVASGLLNFSFTSEVFGTVNNGDTNDNVPGAPNFFVSFANENAAGGQIAYLFFDDNGAGDDDNHDDLVIKLTLVNGSFEVPLPAAAWLMLAGVGALGGLSARRKQKA